MASLGTKCLAGMSRPLGPLRTASTFHSTDFFGRKSVLAHAPKRGWKSIQASSSTAPPRELVITSDPANNVSENIYSKIGAKLHLTPGHPLNIIKAAIYDYFDTVHKDSFQKFDDLPPIVSAKANFDSVLVPADHVSRSSNDTYYINSDTVLRYERDPYEHDTDSLDAVEIGVFD